MHGREWTRNETNGREKKVRKKMLTGLKVAGGLGHCRRQGLTRQAAWRAGMRLRPGHPCGPSGPRGLAPMLRPARGILPHPLIHPSENAMLRRKLSTSPDKVSHRDLVLNLREWKERISKEWLALILIVTQKPREIPKRAKSEKL